jgi:uncharacterized RDD family membrane protein YckC
MPAVQFNKVYLTPCTAATSSRFASASDKRCSLDIEPMHQDNPYEPSPASVEGSQPAVVPSHQNGELLYAGFWRRFGAYWIDAAIFLPLTGVSYLLGERTRLFYAYWLIPGLLIGLFFHVYLVKRFGGTPGKLVLKTRIALTDGSPVTTKAAFLRYSVLFVLSILSSWALVSGALAMTDEHYFSLSYMAKIETIVSRAPAWYYTVNVLTQIWVWSEFISMLLNMRRRALHDYIAGTVVLLCQ